MEFKLLEYELLNIRQSLVDQLKYVLKVTPTCLGLYKEVKDDLQYCNYILETNRFRAHIENVM